MNQFVAEHAGSVTGTPCGFDRIGSPVRCAIWAPSGTYARPEVVAVNRWVHRNPLRAAASASEWALRVARVPLRTTGTSHHARGILDADWGSIFNAD